jgi:hypothetical protein
MEWIDLLDALRTLFEIVAGGITAIFLLFLFLCVLIGVIYVLFHIINFILKPFHVEIKAEHIFKVLFYPFDVVSKIWDNRKHIRDYVVTGVMGCLLIAFLGICMHQCYSSHTESNHNEEEIEEILDDTPPRGVPSRYW